MTTDTKTQERPAADVLQKALKLCSVEHSFEHIYDLTDSLEQAVASYVLSYLCEGHRPLTITIKEYLQIIGNDADFYRTHGEAGLVLFQHAVHLGGEGDYLIRRIKATPSSETPKYYESSVISFLREALLEKLVRLMRREIKVLNCDIASEEQFAKLRLRQYDEWGNVLCKEAAEKVLKEKTDRIEDGIRIRQVREALSASKGDSVELPPLVEIINERKNSARRVILLIEELLPGFFNKSKSGTIDGDIADKRKALFISLISNKTHGTYRRAFSELNQASYQSSEYRDDKEWARQQAAKLVGTDEE